MKFIKELWQYREMIVSLVKRDFYPIEEFSCLWIKLDNSNVASFQVNFAETVCREVESITYYSNKTGNLDELHSIYKTIQPDKDFIIVDLPEKSESAYAAFIINNEFKLKSVYVSEQHAKKVPLDSGEEHLLAFLGV